MRKQPGRVVLCLAMFVEKITGGMLLLELQMPAMILQDLLRTVGIGCLSQPFIIEHTHQSITAVCNGAQVSECLVESGIFFHQMNEFAH